MQLALHLYGTSLQRTRPQHLVNVYCSCSFTACRAV